MPLLNQTFDPMAPTYSTALDDVREELQALPADRVLPVRLDIPSAILTVLGAAPEARRYKAEIAAVFGDADAAQLERLELVAHAAARAHGAHLALTSGVELDPLVAAVIDARTRLLLDAQSLVARKVIDPKRLAQIIGGQGYKDRCSDVVVLVSIFRDLDAAIAPHTTVTPEDVTAAETAASRLSTAMATQSNSGSAPAQLRERAYTLMVRTYDHVRRMVTYIRSENGDADEITPSLFAGRATRRTASDTTNATTTSPSTSPTTSPTNPIPQGLPGASPFVTNT